jgi:exodeoxyribonuclease V
MGITLSPMQKEAVEKAKAWFLNPDGKQVFVVAGYAGTGKSTIVKAMMEELEITRSEVRFATFTGKAALVLTQKGNPASTLHRLQYEPFEVTDKDTGKKKLVFGKKPFLDPGLKLIVVDEVSMVNKKLLSDLLKYQIPIIAIGDPGQLPPIGEDNGLLKNPDVFLTEIHRQAADNPIIHLSMLARTGKRINYGPYGKDVWVIRKEEITPKMFLQADQVLCGKNNTRQDLNAHIRHHMGFRSDIPTRGDKLVCLKNNWSKVIEDEGIPLINGLIGYVKDEPSEVDYDLRKFRFDFRPEFLEKDYFEGLYGDLTEFLDYEDTIKAEDFLEKEDQPVDKFDYGYAITVHKSQGSEFRKALVYEEFLGKSTHNQWLYTAITRASSKLILAK